MSRTTEIDTRGKSREIHTRVSKKENRKMAKESKFVMYIIKKFNMQKCNILRTD